MHKKTKKNIHIDTVQVKTSFVLRKAAFLWRSIGKCKHEQEGAHGLTVTQCAERDASSRLQRKRHKRLEATKRRASELLARRVRRDLLMRSFVSHTPHNTTPTVAPLVRHVVVVKKENGSLHKLSQVSRHENNIAEPLFASRGTLD